MKIFGSILITLAFLMVALVTIGGVVGILRAQNAQAFVRTNINNLYLLLEVGFGLLVIGTIIYGLGRAVEELQRIRGLLRYSGSPSASEIANQVAAHLKGMSK